MADNTIDSMTGLPLTVAGADGVITKNPDIDPLTGKPYTVVKAQDPLAGTRGMAGDFSAYNGSWSGLSGATPVNPFVNIDEQRARNQSAWDQAANGLAKAGVTFVGAVSENTAGYALGLMDYMAGGLGGWDEFSESMSNNPVGQMFDGINDKVREALPNYKTAEQKSKQGTLGGILNTNFMFDTFANGAAYSLGSIATAYMTGGVGLVSGIAKTAGVTAKMSKGLAAYRVSKAVQSGKPLMDALRQGNKLKGGLNRASKGLGYLEGGAMMSIAESAVEAREVGTRVKEELLHDYMTANSLTNKGDVPRNILNDIESASNNMQNSAFTANMAVLMPTNLLTFHGLLRPMQSGKNAIHGTGFTKEGGKKVLRETIDELPGARFLKGARTYAKPIAKGGAIEGFQEGSQYAISEGLVDYAKTGVEENGSVELFNSFNNSGWNTSAFSHVADKAAENLATPEGREQVIVGAMIGMLTGGIGGIKTSRAKDARTKKALEYFSLFENHANLETLARSSRNGERYMQQMQRAEEAGDTKAYEDAQFALIREVAMQHASNGTFDAFIEKLEDSKDLPQDQFEELFGVKSKLLTRDKFGRMQSADISNKERLDNIIERVKDLKATHEMIEDMYPAKSPKGAIRKNLIRAVGGKKALDALLQEDRDANIYKTALVVASSLSKDSQERAELELRELQKLDPKLNIEKILALNSKKIGEVSIDAQGKESLKFDTENELKDLLLESAKNAIENGASPAKAFRHADLIEQFLSERNRSLRAYQNLELNPEARDLFVSREKAKAKYEEQVRKDKFVDDIIKSTKNAKDLKKAINEFPDEKSEDAPSSQARQRAVDELANRVKAVREKEREFRQKDPKEVTEMDPSEMDPITREAWDNDVANIKTGKRKQAVKYRTSQNTKDKTKKDANKRPSEPATGALLNKPKESVTTKRGRGRKAVDAGNPKGEMFTRSTEGSPSGELNLVPNPKSPSKPFVKVNAQGQDSEGDVQQGHKLNGKPIITGRRLLSDPEVTAGTEVELVVIENDWWNNEATEEEKNDPVKNLPVYIKIGGEELNSRQQLSKAVFGDTYSAEELMEDAEGRRKRGEGTYNERTEPFTLEEAKAELEAITKAVETLVKMNEIKPGSITVERAIDSIFDNFVRKKAGVFATTMAGSATGLKQYIKGRIEGTIAKAEANQQKEKRGEIVGVLTSGHSSLRDAVIDAYINDNAATIITTISEKIATNIYTAQEVDGLGLSVGEHFFNPVEALDNPIMGVVSLNEDKTKKYNIPEGVKDAKQIQEDFQKKSPGKLSPGQVFFVVKDPHGKYVAIAASTAYLSDADQELALKLMQDGELELLDKLVGTNVLYAIDGSSSTKMLIGKQAGENVLYSFNAVDENGKLDPNVPKDLLIRVSDKLVRRVLAGEKIALEKLKGSERGTLLVQPTISISESGIELTDEVAATPKNPQAAQYVANNLEKLLKNIIAAKKYQVSVEALGNPGSYVDASDKVYETKNEVSGYSRYLTEGKQAPSRRGTDGIIGSTAKNVNGSPFIDIGLSLDSNVSIDGKKSGAEAVSEKPIVPPSNPISTPKKTPANKRKKQDPRNLLPGHKGSTRNNPNPNPTPAPEPDLAPEMELDPFDPSQGNELGDNFEIDPKTGLLREVPATQPTSKSISLSDLLGIPEKVQKALDWWNQLSPMQKNLPQFKNDNNYKILQQAIQDDILEYGQYEYRGDEVLEPRLKSQENKPPFRFVTSEKPVVPMDKAKAKAWLKKRGIPIEFYEQALRIGGGTVHGYMTQAGVNLWTQGEVGTEYHESFHYVFRTLLNDAQRKALYTEAKKNFAISKAEIAALRKLNPKLSTAELMELALEERMAEEFRDYVFTAEETAKTIPQKLRKFFKDLYSFIKSLFVNPVGMKQLYSMIESNRLPKKYLRNTEKFGVAATAFAYNEDIVDGEFHKEIKETITTIFMQAYTERTQNTNEDLSVEEYRRLIGHKDDKGQVANFFLDNAFKYSDGHGKLSIADRSVLRNLIRDNQDIGDALVKFKAEVGLPINTGLQESMLSQSPNDQEETALWFQYIHQNWFDTTSTEGLDNVLKFGWRTILAQDLERFGFKVKINNETEENLNRDDANDEQAQFDKIYALNSMEQNPLEGREDVIRKLSNIKSHLPNQLGVTTFIDIKNIVKLIQPAVSGKVTLDQMIESIREKQEHFPELGPVVDALSTEYTEQQQAAFFKVFSNNYTVLKLIEEAYAENGEKTTRLINSNRKSSSNNAIDDWNRGAIEKDISKPDAIFKKVGEKLQVKGIDDVNPETGVVEEIISPKERAELVTQAYVNMNAQDTNTRIEGLADVLHYVGLPLGKNLAESRFRLKNHFNSLKGNRLDQQERNINIAIDKFIEELRPTDIVNSVFTLKIDPKTNAVIKPYTLTQVNESPRNFFITQSKRLKVLADIKGNFESPVAMSLVNGAGKVVFTYNLPTPMDTVLRQIQGKDKNDAEALKIIELMQEDEFFNTLSYTRYQSVIMRLAESGKFDIESFALDVLKNEDEEISNVDYKSATARESLLIRLEMFANSGNAGAHYAVPLQETRGRMDFITMPRFTSIKEMTAAGISDIAGEKALIKALIIQDLIRIARDKRVIAIGENLIQDYHNGKERYNNFQLTHSSITDKKIGNLSLSDHIALDVLDNEFQDKTYTDFHAAIDEMVNAYLDNHVEAEAAELIAKINEYNLNKPGGSRLPLAAINKLGGLNKFIKSYVINDIVARLEMAKLFRGGISMNKSDTDFYKRMGLLNTPGDVMMIKGQSAINPEYGMYETYNEAVIDEIRVIEEMHTNDAKDYYKVLVAQGVSAQEAKLRTDKYYAGKAAAADGQAFISPDMWRAIQEGEGEFSVEDKAWYEKWEKGEGTWKAPYTQAFKMYYEHQKLVEYNTENPVSKAQQIERQYVADMDKNSYVVLTPEFVKGKPALQQLYDRMTDPSSPIHVVNVVSAKKGAKQNVLPVDLTSDAIFKDLVVNKQQGARLRKPQTINDKKFDQVRFNRQIRKDTLNLINRKADYILNRGIDSLETVLSGQDMLDKYHDSFEELMQIQMQELKVELGYDKLITAHEANDAKGIAAARLNIFKNLRDLFMRENLKRDKLTDNMEKQLQLVYKDGIVDFAVPLAFPAYTDKYQNLFLSVFKNRVLKTMMKGKEVVQVASLGGMIADENGNKRELRYLSVTEDKHGTRIVHAEVMINADIAKRFGLKPGDDLSQVPEELLRAVGYRIPHQDKSSTLIMKVVGILPKSYNKSIVVPGNITVMMGSDFDVDKLFVMFPEFAKASPLTNDYAKVTLENYQSLKGEPGQDLKKAALKNFMLDTIEAVSSSPMHFSETITPLETTKLEEIIETLDAIKEMDVEGRPFDSPLKELEMEENYKFSQKLVGVYSKMISGLSVAAAGNEGEGVQVPTARQFEVEGVQLKMIKGTEEGFKILVEHLSAALDAANKILQPQLNDNSLTVGSKAFFYALKDENGQGMSPELVSMLHRTPMVMDFVKLVNVDGLSIRKAFQKLGIPTKTQDLIINLSNEKIALSSPMTREQLEDMMAGERSERYKDDELAVLKNFAISYYAGKDLQEYYAAITTDVADSMSDLGSMQSMVENIEKFESSTNMFGAESVEQFLTGDAYKLSRSFFNAFTEILSLSSDLFLGATPAVKSFKDQFKYLTDKDSFTPEEHRAVDRALFYWMVTQPGSPLNAMIATNDVEDGAKYLVNPLRNIVTDLNKLRGLFPEEIGENLFAARLVAAPSNESDVNRVYNIQFENMDTMTPDLSNDYMRAFDDMLLSEHSEIRNFAKRLVRNQLMTTGFNPGYGAYYDMIPIRFFTESQKGGQSIADHTRAQVREVQQNPEYFNSAMLEIIRAMGTRSTNGRKMIRRTTAVSTTKNGIVTMTSKENLPAILTRKTPGKVKVDKTQILIKVRKNEYKILNQSGLAGQINEINTGAKSVVSLQPNSPSKRLGEIVSNINSFPGFVEELRDARNKVNKQTKLTVISANQNEQRVIERECK